MRLNISVPDELANRVRERGLRVSKICQQALAEALEPKAGTRYFVAMTLTWETVCVMTRTYTEVVTLTESDTMASLFSTTREKAGKKFNLGPGMGAVVSWTAQPNELEER